MDQVEETDKLDGPEGLEDPISEGWGDCSLDAVFTGTEPRSLGETVDRTRRNRYVLAPEFQRDFV